MIKTSFNHWAPMLFAFYILFFNGSSSLTVHAACVDEKPVCVDGPGSKFINGVEIFRDCWNYQYVKTCEDSETINFCQGLEKLPSCQQVQTTCVEYSLSGQCLASKNLYECSEAIKDDADIIEVDFSHTVNSGSDSSECQSFLDNPNCFIAKEECIEKAETRLINGVAVYKDCWKKQVSYSCASSGSTNSCQVLDKAGCTPIGEATCIRQENDQCIQYQQTYHCADMDLIEGEDISTSNPPASSGWDLVHCTQVTENMNCTVKEKKCLIEGENNPAQCTQYEYLYRCVDYTETNQCEALDKLSECTEKSSKCIEREGLKCLAYEKQILCQGDRPINGEGADKIDESIIIGSLQWSDTCSPIEQNPNCSILQSTCVEEGGSKEINGQTITKDCWRWEHTYVCGSNGSQNDCGPLEANQSCVKIQSECIFTDDSGKCLTYAHTYRCEEKEGSTTTETICRPTEGLPGLGIEPDAADKDFAWALAVLETARQGAVYGDIDNNLFFNGQADRCTKKVLGFSCCDTKVKAGTSNSSAFGKSITFAASATIETIQYIGSPYVYDVLSASDSTSSLLNLLYGDATSGVYNPSLSFYGFGMTLQGGTMYFTFDPTSFALSVAMQIAMDYLQCEPSEQTLMLKKGQDLCHYVGTYCSKGEAFGCIERSESYCCFNSPLARIVQEQGKLQLGRNWGSAKNPDCQGFSQEELEALDFSLMDLSEFEELIKKNFTPNGQAASNRGEDHLQNLIDKNLGGYVNPQAGKAHVTNPNFTGGSEDLKLLKGAAIKKNKSSSRKSKQLSNLISGK